MSFGDSLKALAAPERRKILELLKDGKMAAGDIASHFELTGPTLSYHLSVLKKADLIRENRQKNFIFYELNASVFEELLLWCSQFKGQTNK